MAEGTSNSLVNLGDLSKPADTLVKKISKAVGGIFQPYQIKRVAKAEAEASLIKAETEIQITDLHRRAMHRFVEEEAQRQKNIEGITARTLPQLADNAKPENIDDDWLTHFFEKCRIISDVEMQKLWSRVLAGEAEAKGRFSKRTVNFLSELDKTDAEMFSKLCGFGCVFGRPTILIFNHHEEIYRKNGITFSLLMHLESIGLISYHHMNHFNKSDLPEKFPIFYYGNTLLLTIPNGNPNHQFSLGKVLLTKLGEELAQVCDSNSVDGFLDYLKNKWRHYLVAPERNASESNVSPNTDLGGIDESPPPTSPPVYI